MRCRSVLLSSLLAVLAQGWLAAAHFRTSSSSTMTQVTTRREKIHDKANGKHEKDMKEKMEERIYTNKPLLRGEFHRFGALLYPFVLGIPLYVRAKPQHRKASLCFSAAVEGIMVVSGVLHTTPWRQRHMALYEAVRKADFCMIFVGIALFYSSIGKLLFADATVLFGKVIEPVVWTAAIAGAVAKCVFPNAPHWCNALIFLLQGWAAGPLVPALFQKGKAVVRTAEIVGLLLGAGFVTFGATAYSVQWPSAHVWNARIFGPHEMFHAGTIGMFVAFWSTMWLRVAR